MSSKKMPLSVAIITKNEERNLPACLGSVSFAEDLVVVDSGSTDRTVELAKEFGCRVFVEDWKGYGPQKNSAIEKCRYEWILIVDADERIPDVTKRTITRVINDPKSADAYSFKRKNYFHGKWMKSAGNWPDRIVRLVRKGKGSFRSVIHERWKTEGRVKDLDAHIDHFGFVSYSDMLETMNWYSTVTAGELFASGRRAGPLSPLYHGIGTFLKTYLLQKGLLEGLDGFVIALTKAGGAFFKYAKLLELQRGQKDKWT